jgi:hypothetical protein
MPAIEISFDTFKALTARRASESVSYDDVIRGLLPELREKSPPCPPLGDALSGAWIVKGVTFPNGMEFRGRYQGRVYTGRVESGALVLEDGRRYGSPSHAASATTKHPANGWKFWECRMPGEDWRPMDSYRRRA